MSGALALPLIASPPVALALTTTTMTLAVHDAHHNVVTSTRVGAPVHARVSLSGTVRPTGTVTIVWFGKGDSVCAGKGPVSKPTTLSLGTADVTAFPFLPTDAGTYSVGASYQPLPGSQYAPTHACKAFSVLRASPTVTIVFRLHGDGVVTSVEANQLADIVTTVGGPKGVPLPSGQVSLNWYTDAACTAKEGGATAPLQSGTMTISQRRPAPATRWYRALYSGDSRFTTNKSACMQLVWTKATPTFNGVVHDPGHVTVSIVVEGTAVHAFLRVRGFIIEDAGEVVPTGQVQGSWFQDAACTQLAGSFGPVMLQSGQVEITESTRLFEPGSYGLRLQYLGNAIYKASLGACLPLTVTAVATTPPVPATSQPSTPGSPAPARTIEPSEATAGSPTPETSVAASAWPASGPPSTASPGASPVVPSPGDTGATVDPLILVGAAVLLVAAIVIGFVVGSRGRRGVTGSPPGPG